MPVTEEDRSFGPEGWLNPQFPPGANVLSESPIAYTLDSLLTGASAPFGVVFFDLPGLGVAGAACFALAVRLTGCVCGA